MHTFFINTTGRELLLYREILEIPVEQKKLILLDAPLKEGEDPWQFRQYAEEIGRMIEVFSNIRENFNLIVYVDLKNFSVYRNISEEDQNRQDSVCNALRLLLRHYFSRTILKEINGHGLNPSDTLVITEQCEESSRNLAYKGSGTAQAVWELLGLPDRNALSRIWKTETEKRYEALCELFLNGPGNEALKGFRNASGEELKLIAMENAPSEQVPDIEEEAEKLRLLLEKSDSREWNKTTVLTGSRSQTQKQKTMNSLTLSLYLLQCVSLGRLSYVDDSSAVHHSSLPLPEFDWEKLTAYLRRKAEHYLQKYREIESMEKNYGVLKIVPELYCLPESLGIGEDGYRLKNVVATDQYDTGKPDGSRRNAKLNKYIIKRKSRVSKIEDLPDDALLKEYKRFKFEDRNTSDDLTFRPSWRTATEKYETEALQIRQKHVTFRDRLENHVKDAMSDYSGYSMNHDLPLLKKPNGKDAGTYPSESRKPDLRKPEVVKNVSENALKEARVSFLQFCASGNVGLTDVERACSRFLTKNMQIKESRKHFWGIGGGALAGLLIGYLPYILLQRGSFTADWKSLAVFGAGIVFPVIVLAGSWLWQYSRLWRENQKAWYEYSSLSQNIFQDNENAVRKYDDMLAREIPRLRWISEYHSEVDFYQGCCMTADARLVHHHNKLGKYYQTVRTILDHIDASTEISGNRPDENRNEESIPDFESAFCSGSTNCTFYSILDPAETNEFCAESEEIPWEE